MIFTITVIAISRWLRARVGSRKGKRQCFGIQVEKITKVRRKTCWRKEKISPQAWCVVSHILRHQYSQLVTPHLLLRGATINTSSHALSFWITLLRLQVLNMIFCFKYQWQKIRWFWIILVLVYRLSVTEASSNDTGVYTCTGPTVTVWPWWS